MQYTMLLQGFDLSLIRYGLHQKRERDLGGGCGGGGGGGVKTGGGKGGKGMIMWDQPLWTFSE